MNVNLLVNGQKSFAVIFQQIQQATKSIEICMFIWRNDTIGEQLALHLLDAANRGVQVTITKDKIGAIFEYSEETRQSMFHHTLSPLMRFQAWFMYWIYPMPGKALSNQQSISATAVALMQHANVSLQLDKPLKDHSKYYIIDEKVLIIGGVNVEDKEVSCDVQGSKYHDYMLSVHSAQVIAQLKRARQQGGDVAHPLNKVRPEQFDFIINVQTGQRRLFTARDSLYDRLQQAQKSVTLVMAYINDIHLCKTLVKLVQRGVTLRIYMPKRANIQHDINCYYMQKLMRACDNNIDLYLCEDMIHAKLMWIDGNYMSFGSINFNRQAMNKLQETNIGCFTEYYNLTSTLQTSIDTIAQRSQQITSWQQIKYDRVNVFLEQVLG